MNFYGLSEALRAMSGQVEANLVDARDLDGSNHPTQHLLMFAEAVFGPQFDEAGRPRWGCGEVEGCLTVTDGQNYYALGKNAEIIVVTESIKANTVAADIGRLSLI